MNTPDATQNTPSEPKLLDQLRDWIRLKHYSIRSEAQYVTHGWVPAQKLNLREQSFVPFPHSRLAAVGKREKPHPVHRRRF